MRAIGFTAATCMIKSASGSDKTKHQRNNIHNEVSMSNMSELAIEIEEVKNRLLATATNVVEVGTIHQHDRHDLTMAIAASAEAKAYDVSTLNHLASELVGVIHAATEFTVEIAEALESALPVLSVLGDEKSLETAEVIEAAVKSVNTKQVYPE
ncbi:hypothetical protein [Shewanella sp. Shew256]|jgi:predicted nucleotide-binding protein|uniref:hypothetical protein n=1 Tax=Shewanella sp. Shew256 TaxID=1969376 RepID=UPI000B499015|nr:hypothetical protein [Shewanella sp. Shew256]